MMQRKIPTERELFDQAMSLAEGVDLAAFFEEASRGNGELAQRVMALVGSSKVASQIFPCELPGMEKAGEIPSEIIP